MQPLLYHKSQWQPLSTIKCHFPHILYTHSQISFMKPTSSQPGVLDRSQQFLVKEQSKEYLWLYIETWIIACVIKWANACGALRCPVTKQNQSHTHIINVRLKHQNNPTARHIIPSRKKIFEGLVKFFFLQIFMRETEKKMQTAQLSSLNRINYYEGRKE